MPKIELENFVQYGRLFEVYGSLLSEDRQQILREYFSFNMTLAEIAQERKISRQAVFDALKKSCEKLNFFEEKLNFVEKEQALSKKLTKLSQKFPIAKEEIEKIMKEF